MTREILDVRIECVDGVAGALVREDGQLGFAYRPAYLAAPGALPFSVRLPLRDVSFDARTTRDFFANLLPEGRLLDQKARRLDLEPDDVFGLLRHFGAETAGALSVLPVDSPPVKRPGRFPDDYRPIPDEELRALVADLERGRTVSLEGAADPSLAGVLELELPRFGGQFRLFRRRSALRWPFRTRWGTCIRGQSDGVTGCTIPR